MRQLRKKHKTKKNCCLSDDNFSPLEETVTYTADAVIEDKTADSYKLECNIKIPESGKYLFKFKSTAGIEFYINGKMVERKNAHPYIVANLPKSARSVGYYHDNMSIKGNKILIDGEKAPFNYTIEYKSDEICKMAPYECGVFNATEYTEVLPNGVEHSIIEMTDNAPLDSTEIFTVPENHLFFMGDNRDNSADSRTAAVSYVNRDNILGRVWFIWYSHNYYAPMLAIWHWGDKMRWDRFGKNGKK